MVDYATNYQLLNILAKNPPKTFYGHSQKSSKNSQKPAKNPLKILQLNNCYTKNILCFNNKLTKNN
jgi:hypothetical protein